MAGDGFDLGLRFVAIRVKRFTLESALYFGGCDRIADPSGRDEAVDSEEVESLLQELKQLLCGCVPPNGDIAPFSDFHPGTSHRQLSQQRGRVLEYLFQARCRDLDLDVCGVREMTVRHFCSLGRPEDPGVLTDGGYRGSMTPWLRMPTGSAARREATRRELGLALAGARCLLCMFAVPGTSRHRALVDMLARVLDRAERALGRLD